MTEYITQDLADDLLAQIKVYLDSKVEPAVEAEPDNIGGIKVGDTVRVLKDGAWWATVSKGDTFKVIGLTHSAYDPHVTVERENGSTWVFRPGIDVELAKPTFAVGDRVVVKKPYSGVTAFGTIEDTEYMTDFIKVRYDCTGGFDHFREADIESLDERPVPSFAVGDRVLVEKQWSAGTIAFGTISRIDVPCCGNDEYKVNYDDGDYDYYGESALESLDEREPVRLTKGEEPEVGEQLVFVENYAGYKPGDLATVQSVDSPAYAGDPVLVTVSTPDGFGTSAFPTRFGRL